jgi:hypothetical protein
VRESQRLTRRSHFPKAVRLRYPRRLEMRTLS